MSISIKKQKNRNQKKNKRQNPKENNKLSIESNNQKKILHIHIQTHTQTCYILTERTKKLYHFPLAKIFK